MGKKRKRKKNKKEKTTCQAHLQKAQNTFANTKQAAYLNNSEMSQTQARDPTRYMAR